MIMCDLTITCLPGLRKSGIFPKFGRNSDSDGPCSALDGTCANDKEGIPGKHAFPHPLSQHLCPPGQSASIIHEGNTRVEHRFSSIQGVFGQISPYSTGTGGALGRAWVLISTK